MCNSWRVEDKHSGRGHDLTGSFDEAIAAATKQCKRDADKWVVWQQPAKVRMAEVNSRGACWLMTKLTGEEVTALMRRHHQTIAGLAFVMGITQKRIRQVRKNGLTDRNSVRDWLEAITGIDPGPLPERYRISLRPKEGDCCECGYPLFVGEYAYEYAFGMFCSLACCRAGYRRKVEQVTF